MALRKKDPHAGQQDLFGRTPDVFKSAQDRYGVWPLTIWDCDKSDSLRHKLMAAIGDGCGARQGCGTQSYRSARAGCFQEGELKNSSYKLTESIFDPLVAQWILNCYAPKEGLCFDPFAGGGTRAIMAAKRGLQYLGVELRREEVRAVRQRCEHVGVKDRVRIVCHDSRDCTAFAEDASADFCYTCPPYWNLEEYKGGDADLSMLGDYRDFIRELGKVVAETGRVLKPGAFSCWVVGLHRDKFGGLACMQHDLARLHRKAGFLHKEEIILRWQNCGNVQRVGNFERGKRLMVRTHEYLEVYVKE